MSSNGLFAKSLRWIGIVLMALTGSFTLLGGIGTACAALFPTKYDSMAALAPYQLLYIAFVLTGILLGILGIRTTVMLIRGTRRSYRAALIVLIAGAVIGFIHISISRAVRGSSMPVDAVVYTTVLTLVLFLIFRLPFIWRGVDFTKGNFRSNGPAASASAILIGLLTLSIKNMMASTHTWNGVNYAGLFSTGMALVGSGLVLAGITAVAYPFIHSLKGSWMNGDATAVIR